MLSPRQSAPQAAGVGATADLRSRQRHAHRSHLVNSKNPSIDEL
jgi:hypothetical protein